MRTTRRFSLLALPLLALAGVPAWADPPPAPHGVAHARGDRDRLQQPPPPRLWHQLPPTHTQARYRLANHRITVGKPLKRPVESVVTAECSDAQRMATYSGASLADYLVALPDVECTYGLFSLPPDLAATLYSPANLDAVAARFTREANRYAGNNAALALLTLYLRAGYYLADNGGLSGLDASLVTRLRPVIARLLDGTALFGANPSANTTAQEIGLLITNMHDETSHLAAIARVFARYTNSEARPQAAEAARESTAARGLSGLLSVVYFAHYRGASSLATDPVLTRTLFAFASANRAALTPTESAFLLRDAARESLRFMQYPDLKPIVEQEAKSLLNVSSMTGADNDLWLAAAEAVKYYDAARCAEYGTCDLERRLSDAFLARKYTCGTIRMRAQAMTDDQFQSACSLMLNEESSFHRLLATQRKPVADDFNRRLDVSVFDDYDQYSKYASLIYGIDTNNGGMYLEGDPSDPHNQARFIAHEASWLRPAFKVWNLEHEYIHYLDGRFNLYGDFARSTREPTVWWIEGLAEYASKAQDNPDGVARVRNARYALSTIFGNTYTMRDYVDRAYGWGYMAVRFMFERHRPDVDAILQRFRAGDYFGYRALIQQIGTRYDEEFAQWMRTEVLRAGARRPAAPQRRPEPATRPAGRTAGHAPDRPENA